MIIRWPNIIILLYRCSERERERERDDPNNEGNTGESPVELSATKSAEFVWLSSSQRNNYNCAFSFGEREREREGPNTEGNTGESQVELSATKSAEFVKPIEQPKKSL